ncbi:MAG TPA: AGE family epimerase/isomerase [Puia sp.]|jgi:mannobiose 2-epimerase|nr:AGE family epimerase/isomerase [Puia sp.]
MNDQNNSLSMETAWNILPAELLTELNNIIHYWELYSLDRQGGGFIGRIDQDNHIHTQVPKGSVLNTRILWSFSAVYRYTQNPLHLELATRAYHYICEYFSDPEFGGLYWSVDHLGKMIDNHKQVYAQAFGIYAMSEYYRVTKNPKALELALEWYGLIEKYSRDPKHGGYIDAFAGDWTFLEDKRLSAKDENASKTMNTHLHLVEAYANLYEVWPSQKLKRDIIDLLNIFDKKIIHPSGHHLILFFSDDWKMDQAIISYGHDIEAAWLLQSCAESIGDTDSIKTAKKNALLITTAAMEGLDKDGGLWYEFNNNKNELLYEKHWWPQAEALIGFCNAWQLTGNSMYKNVLLRSWQFIQNHILDKTHGEWLWGIDKDNKKMQNQDKVGMWKGPYHNSRACLELLKRL